MNTTNPNRYSDIALGPSLDEKPRSCWEAACLRNIALDEELKTLLVRGSKGIVALHLLSHCDVNPDMLYPYCPGFEFVPPIELFRFGLESGTINPVNIGPALREKLSLVLISSLVFGKNAVYTNDGTHYGSYKIQPPALLKLHSRVIVYDFQIEKNFGIRKIDLIPNYDICVSRSSQ